MRNIWYAVCDTWDDYKESRLIKKSFGWELLDIISSDAPILEGFLLLMEFLAFLCSRKRR